ncbi:MAG TPA: DinB family protein [Chloroflexota bacterium]|nr:DinB family protein [Chloroflexota bacterium]
MNAQLEAGLAVVDELLEGMQSLLAELDDDAVNWTPLPSDTNSIAVMVVHTLSSLDTWLSRGFGVELPRNRDAEFSARLGATELVERVVQARERAKTQFARLASLDLASPRELKRSHGALPAEQNAAWCVEHALIHAGEHWGQIQLTRQLYDAR